MSVEEWKDESNAIPPGEVTLPSKEEITIQPGEFIVKPVFFLRELEFYIRVVPIKRKWIRYSKKYIKKIAIKSRNLGEATDLNKEQ